jgi:hypothetical protein
MCLDMVDDQAGKEFGRWCPKVSTPSTSMIHSSTITHVQGESEARDLAISWCGNIEWTPAVQTQRVMTGRSSGNSNECTPVASGPGEGDKGPIFS